MRFDVVIVGAGHGGAQAAIALRQRGFEGTLAIIGDEPELPYERPPLSKAYLSGDKAFQRMLIRPATFWLEKSVKMLLNRQVVTVDAEAHIVTTADGEAVAYQQLIWATGGSPRRLSCAGSDLKGVHTVRTRADVDRMSHEMATVSNVAVVGGGFIGLEAAAVLSGLGKKVVLVEAMDRVLSRVAGEPLSRFYEAEHRARGVEIRLGAAVERLEGERRVSRVHLNDGHAISAEMVIVGIGIVPAVQPLIAAGAAGGNGVAVNAQCRTSLPDIFAIGDCALHVNPFADDRPVRLESVQNATDQAVLVAKAIMGHEEIYEAVPWFWSDQYDLKLQTAGLAIGHDATVVRGDPANRSFSLVYLREGRMIAIDCVNAPKEYVKGRKQLVERLLPDAASLADATIPLNPSADLLPGLSN